MIGKRFIVLESNKLLLFIASFVGLLWGATVYSEPSCIVKHYSTDDGLSHSGVMCMLQDHKGIMWFGTWDGLNKFDGYTFTNYKSRPGDSCNLSHNRIDYIKEDRFGFLWVKTYDDKIHRFDRRTESFRGVPQSINQYSTLNIRISSIYETHNGDMWLVAKTMGCFRIITDTVTFGFNVIHYSSNYNDKFLLSNNNVNFVFEDRQCNLWVGTENGLNCLVSKQKSVIDKVLQRFGSYNFTSVFELDGNLFFGTKDGKLLRFNQKDLSVTVYPLSGSPEIVSMVGYSNDQICIGTRYNGLYLFNSQQRSFLNLTDENSQDLGDNRIKSLYKDKFGLIWIETVNPGVVRFDTRNRSFRRFVQVTDKVSPYVYPGNFYNIFEDIRGVLWVSLKGGGFGFYNRSADRLEYIFNQPESAGKLFSNLVTCSLSDSYGNLWLSTYSRGIEKICFIQDKFRFYTPSQTHSLLSSNEVRAIFEDMQGYLWVATREGKLYCYDKNHHLKKVFSSQTKGPGEISFSGMVYAIMQDREGAMWFGTKGDGVIRASRVGPPEDLKFKTEQYRNKTDDLLSISNDFIYSIMEDSKGRIWIGTFGGGLNLLEKKEGKIQFRNTNTSFHNYPGTAFNKIRDIQEDGKGRMWVGTTSGLIIFNPDEVDPDNIQFYHVQKKPGDINSLSGNDVHYIFKDKNKGLWIGTFGGGLNKVTGDSIASPRFKTYNTADDLPIDIVLSIQEDDKNHLWLSTEKGLSMFDPKTEVFQNFSQSDGLKNMVFSEAACCKSRNGELYFGCTEGYYSFSPDSISVDKTYPPLVLINLQLFNKNVVVNGAGSPLKQSISETKVLTLQYNQSVFSIEYAGLDYRNSEKLEYAFMLEGFEKEWNFVRKQRKATYTNLRPGQYVFRVKCTSTGVFGDKDGQDLIINILPPWWKTWWAFVGYFIFASVIAFFVRRLVIVFLDLRNKVIIEHKLTDLKLRFFTNISHELRTPLTLIIAPAEELLKGSFSAARSREYVEIINKNAKRMLRHVNQLLDFRKIQTGKMRLKIAENEMVSFVRDIYMDFKELASSRNIDFRFSSNTKKLKAWVDAEKIDTVIFNLLSNAFKFTPERSSIEVIINGLSDCESFEIIVKDKGVGIAKDDLPLLFERFAISHNPSDSRSKGTGIGLSLAKEIVDLHHGTIDVESAQGVGSSFTICLRRGREHFDSKEVVFDTDVKEIKVHDIEQEDIHSTLSVPLVEKEIHFKQNTPVLLLVEDNVDLRTYLFNKLVEGFNVVEAVDGRDGWNKAQSLIPDLIVSDIMMPHMDGIELTDKLRNDFKTSHIPIILLTAKNSVESMIEGIQYGADAYITKPFVLDHLLVQINNLLDGRKRLLGKYSNAKKIVDLSPSEIVVTAKDGQFLKEVIRSIEDNLANPEFNVDKIATTVGLGRTTFFKKIKGLTGLAPVEFMRDMRVKRGHQLLQTDEFTIAEVAYQIGFSDPGYFSKCFKEKYNITPTDFLKTFRNN
jgi:signal transduction histidine kinase/ligand-binding sensor domain-containing protein/AraC-like DNA-binding protein